MHVTSSRAWLALIACGVALAFAVLWGFFGSVSVTVAAPGIAMHPGGLRHITAVNAGTIVELRVHSGDRVRSGQLVALEKLASGRTVPIRSDWNGTIGEVAGGVGSYFQAGGPLARVDERSPLIEAIVFIPLAQTSNIKPGMRAEVQPGGEASSRYGFIYGHVRSVSQYALSPQRLHYLLDNVQLEQALTGGFPVREVRVALESAPTPSGLHWSISTGPSAPIAAGTLCSSKIVVKRLRPVNLLYPQE